jgi:4-amino-4-deoxy-L-arabinose transferase-like glycosyltransferase
VATVIAEVESRPRGPIVSPSAGGVQFSTWSTIFWMVLVAFAVRVSFLLIFRTYRFDRIDDFCISGETTNIAQSITAGHGFRSAFDNRYTGPTAWIAPAYPYFLALVFRLFGVLTRTTIIVVFSVQSMFSALTVIPILGIAKDSVGKRAGLWAAWTWILFPWFSKWSVTWIWDMSLSALLLSLLFWYALALPEASVRKAWIGFGALFGFALLVNPALGSFLPVALIWCCRELHRRKREWLKPALISVLACVVAIAPWLIRNRVVFGQWVFLRSNFGFEFALGNYHGSLGRGWGGPHPSGNPKEYAEYREMGEIAYVRSRRERAFRFVRDYPLEFLTLTGKRVGYFWDGSAMNYFAPVSWYWVPSSFLIVSLLLLPALLVARRQNLPAWQLFFGALLVYPAPYYLTFSQVRYRHAVEPIILLLIAYAGVTTASRLNACFRSIARKRSTGNKSCYLSAGNATAPQWPGSPDNPR